MRSILQIENDSEYKLLKDIRRGNLMNRSFYHLTIALVAMLLFLSVGLLEAVDVANILDLWEVRDGLTGDYTQTADINLDVTNPTNLVDWAASTSYSVGDIRKHPSDGFAYYCLLHNSTYIWN
jgi:hypothetical protein